MRSLRLMKMVGFTLIEMLLVMAIISTMIVLSIGYMNTRTRALTIDRTSAQMQQILNAGLSYYVNNNAWPADISTMQSAGYLPMTAVLGQIPSSFGTFFSARPNPANPGNVPPIPAGIVFQVSISLPTGYANAATIGEILAGKLPFGTVSTVAPPPPPPSPSGEIPNNSFSSL